MSFLHIASLLWSVCETNSKQMQVEVGLKPCSCLGCLQLILQGYRELHYYLDLTSYTFLTVVFAEECQHE